MLHSENLIKMKDIDDVRDIKKGMVLITMC